MNKIQENTDRLTLLWPVCLMGLSLAVFLGWQVSLAVMQYVGAVRVAEQQGLLEAQAVQTEAKFQAMVMDLMTLAKKDADAKRIVTKYGIQFNPPPAPRPPAPVAAPKPDSQPTGTPAVDN